MYVPNYIPPPVEVPQNVTQERYVARLGFVRRVSVLHLLSVLAIAAIATIARTAFPLGPSVAALGAILLALCLVRIARRATKMDQIFSLALSPALLVALAVTARSIENAGWPLWGMVVGVAGTVLYSLCCGRDF